MRIALVATAKYFALRLIAVFMKEHPQIDIRIYVGNRHSVIATVKQAVMVGLGVALISAHTVEVELAAGRLVLLQVEGLPLVREWYVMHHAERVLTPAGSAMWNFIVTKGNSFLPGAIVEPQPAKPLEV